MDKYIPESCPFRYNPDPDEAEFTEERCAGCKDRCIMSSVAILKRATIECVERLMEPVCELASCLVDSIAETGTEAWNNLRPFIIGRKYPSFEDIKRKERHVRTWKRRDPRNGKSKKDR